MEKYEFTGDTIVFCGKVLHRIKALRDFGDIRTGDIGGFIEKEENLSHDGDCWVAENACVYGGAWVDGNTKVFGETRISGRDDLTSISGDD